MSDTGEGPGDQGGDFSQSLRRQLIRLLDDLKDIRDQGKRATLDEREVPLFKGMYSTVCQLFDRYDTLYTQLSDLVDESGRSISQAADHVARRTAKRYLHESHAMMITFKEAKAEANTTQAGVSTFNLGTSRPRAKLPTLHLDPFNGDRVAWPRFRDMFESLVISDPELSDIDRYHYLVASVRDTAKATIANLPITADNFELAWQSLKDVFENKRLLAATYLDNLLELRPLESKASTEDTIRRVAELSEYVAAFKQLNVPEAIEFVFFHLASRSIDSKTRVSFETHNTETFPKFDSLIAFLRKCTTAAELALSHTSAYKSRFPYQRDSPGRRTSSFSKPTSTKSVLFSNTQVKPLITKPTNTPCPVCRGQHWLANCARFGNAAPDQRHQLIKNWKGCRNCLQNNHPTRSCSSKQRCSYCPGIHHPLLHIFDKRTSVSQPTNRQPDSRHTPTPLVNRSPSTSTQHKPISLNSRVTFSAEIILGTALCRIGSSSSNMQSVRLVLDSGSHLSFITRSCANRLGLHIEAHSSEILGIGETPLSGFKGRTTCILSPVHMNNPVLSTTVIVVDKITAELPGIDTPSQIWDPYQKYDLADPQFWVTRPVDFLLGCDLFADILTGQVITVMPSMPKLLGTIFGYAVVGRLKDLTEASHLISLHTSPSPLTEILHNELQRFWELEDPPIVAKHDPIDDESEKLFKETHYRLPCGRYVVRLPFKDNNLPGSNTKGLALRRLTHLESKLERNSLLKAKYHDFMREYEALDHMELAQTPGRVFIPHHCVVKGEGSDMKIRVVFDASARTNQRSLNESLAVGPKLQTNIVHILLNFRLHKYVFTTDAVKMYRQILIHPEDRSMQHILWRFNLADSVKDYELKTVSYGQSSAPYLALRVIQQLVADEGHDFPKAACIIPDDMYIDDVATGASTLEEVLELQRQVIELMSRGGFSLGKWAANHPSLTLAATPNESKVDSSTPVIWDTDRDISTIKILGLQWDPSSDTFLYKICPPSITYTKRGVLSAIARIYDPLGYLGPTVVLAKELIQVAWKHRLDWDELFPPDLQRAWAAFVEQLPLLSQLRIPRWILSDPSCSPHLLIFADASEKAYCATAYIYIQTKGSPTINLLLAKTKLAPVKTLTIPRLELCAAVLASRLFQSLSSFCKRLHCPIPTYFFTDSTVVLAWLKTPTFQLKTFVANRVELILDLTKGGNWYHVASPDNPSDLGSRGLLPGALIHNSLWFHGPAWARNIPEKWPLNQNIEPTEIPETKQVSLPCTLTATMPLPSIMLWMERISTFTKIIRSFSYALRFIDALRKPPLLRKGPLLIQEIRKATTLIIKIVQAHEFFNSPVPVTSNTPFPKSLCSLHPFFDTAGVVLVGGRLQHSPVSWSRQHPIILPCKGHFTRLLLNYYHRVLLHPGPTVLLAVLRSKYWVLGARNAVRQITRNCVTCRKLNAPPTQPLMGDLPSSRFRDGRAFLHVGIDFAGPFHVRESLRRKAHCYKAYLCLFVCLSTRALHLEIVSALSTEAFCAALERFIARRGLPEKIFSDNGTNFVGAANQLKNIHSWYTSSLTQQQLTIYAAQKEIEWAFSPPSAAFFGGLWEAGVKAVKRLLRSIYGDNTMTFEELGTWFARIEAILNSRPLYPLASDPNDLAYLSPGHFLVGSPLLAVPEKSMLDLPENRLSRWQLIYQKSQHFWKRWRLEYLSTLQERAKWRRPDINVKIGDLVILKEESTPRMQWPVARITEIHPGPDQIVRVATIKTSTTTLKRPVNKLVPLFLPSTPLPSPEETN